MTVFGPGAAGLVRAPTAKQQARRGTEAVITAPTRNRMGAEKPHKGSNPFLSAIFLLFQQNDHSCRTHDRPLKGRGVLGGYPAG